MLKITKARTRITIIYHKLYRQRFCIIPNLNQVQGMKKCLIVLYYTL